MSNLDSIIYPYIDKVLSSSNIVLTLNRLSSIQYLALVFVITLSISLVLFIRSDTKRHIYRRSTRLNVVIYILYLVLVVGMITSYGAYHYSVILIAGLAAALTALAFSTDVKEPLALALLVLVIFGVNFRLLASGVEEGETASDMINIYMNGFFRWSIHGGHYDFAPLDAVAKVIASYVLGTNVYDPLVGTFLYVLHGVAAVLIVYSLIRKVAKHLLALIALVMTSFPYSPLIGLTVPPAPLSHMMGLIAYAVVLSSNSQWRGLLVAMPFLIYAILVHPTSLGLLLVLTATLIATYISSDKSSNSTRLLYILAIASSLYFLKVFYTAFSEGFISFLNLLWNYILNAFREEQYEFTTRNVAYSGLPRISITGFALFPAIVGAYTLTVLFKLMKSLRKKERVQFIDTLFISIVFLYIVFSIASFLTGIGGVSQSRAIYNGIQPYAEFALVLHAAKTLASEATPSKLSNLLRLLLIASLFTLITPNAMHLNYSIPMAKPATWNDHVIAYTYTGLIDKNLFLQLYNSYGEYGRLVAVKERGEFYYGLGGTMAVVYYYIAPRVVDAKSYWDPRIMAVFSAPKNPADYTENKVFDAWVYGFYLYLK